MNCTRYRNDIALYVGGDLSTEEVGKLNEHLARCSDCGQVLESLERDQSLFRSFRQDTVSASALSEMRHGVLARVGSAQDPLGWFVRFERFLMLGFRKPRHVLACVGVLTILSAIAFPQMLQTGLEAAGDTASFTGDDELVRPAGYREWIFVGTAIGADYRESVSAVSTAPGLIRSVYIHPAAYRRYVSTGEFPEGTILVLESAKAASKGDAGLEGWYEKEFVGLQASVKDSRFEGGWGYFDFTGTDGRPLDRAQPESSACLSCHRDRAETDHVFTQFYPILRASSRVL